jgi:hypothetical protein
MTEVCLVLFIDTYLIGTVLQALQPDSLSFRWFIFVINNNKIK